MKSMDSMRTLWIYLWWGVGISNKKKWGKEVHTVIIVVVHHCLWWGLVNEYKKMGAGVHTLSPSPCPSVIIVVAIHCRCIVVAAAAGGGV